MASVKIKTQMWVDDESVLKIELEVANNDISHLKKGHYGNLETIHLAVIKKSEEIFS